MTERSESERAELVAIAGQIDIFIKYGTNAIFEPDDAKKIASALRRLAAQDQKPVALAHVRLEDDGLFADLEVLDGTNLQPSMSPVALYLSPPPAAGWDEAVTACKKIAENPPKPKGRGHACIATGRDIAAAIAALRHNAPPDSGAGKSEPPHWREVEMMRLIDLLRSKEGDSVTILCDNPDFDFNGQPNCAIVCNGGWTNWQDLRFAQDTLLDALSAAMIEYKRPRDPAVLPDHGGADAGVRDILAAVLFAKWSREANGWPDGEWSEPDWGAWRNRTKLNPVGLSRTAFEEEADFLLKEVQPALSKPAPVAANEDPFVHGAEDEAYALGRRDGYEDAIQDLDIATGGDGEFKGSTIPGETVDVETMKQRIVGRSANASTEARLREALEHYADQYCEGWCEQDAGFAQFEDCGGCLARRALSAHPHASDCAKQGTTTFIPVQDAEPANVAGRTGGAHPPTGATPSDRADVTEEAAKAAFRQAQSVYRSDHDHFPITNTWERLDERIREGWRKIACSARMKFRDEDENFVADVIAPYFQEGYTARDAARALLDAFTVGRR